MRVLYHHRTQGRGAEGVHIAHIIKGLRELGHEVDVVSPLGEDPLETAGGNPFREKVGVKAKALGWLSKVLPQFLFEGMEMAYNTKAATHLRAAHADKPVDFLYERNAFFLHAGARFAREHKLPYIVEVNEVAGHARVRGQTFVGKARAIEKEVFDQADAIIVVSTFLKEQISELGVDSKKIHVMPNGVDESRFAPALADPKSVRARYGIADSTVVLGFIGWFVPWHQLDRLLDVFARLSSKHDVKLMLVGDGTLKQDLLVQVERLGVADRVIFTGAVPYEGVPDHVAAMDVCLIPASNDYRSPIKLFEYMAMGRTVVAPATEPVCSVVSDGEDALLFAPDDEQGMEMALERACCDQVLRRALGDAALAKVLSQHTWTHNVRRLVELVDEI